MKTISVVVALMIARGAMGQSYSETITRQLAFEKQSPANVLIIANISGEVTVTAHEEDKIFLEVKKTIRAKTDARLQEGKVEVQLGVLDRADTIILYVRDGCKEFSRGSRNARNRGWQTNQWGYHTYGEDCHLTYDYDLDFTVRVPATLNLDVGTINNGNLRIENTAGRVRARNVNGGISLINLTGPADAHTVNGDVDVEYARNPGKDCRFYTLNGNINASFQPGLSASIGFESFNGSFYTNIPKIEKLPGKIEKRDHGDGIQYKISENSYRVGRGGALLDFETFNGNLYLKEKTQ